MRRLSFISAFFLVLGSSNHHFTTVSATSIARDPHTRLRKHYARAHSLKEGHDFNSGEWHTVNVTDLGYKYEQPVTSERSQKSTASGKVSDIGGTVSHLLNDVWNGLKGTGDSDTVKITWYT